MYAPIREGNRGGRGLFSWEDVRVMSYRDRECYLGSTISLGYLDKGGRWRKKDWWVKNPDNKDNIDLDSIRKNDLSNINQALGIVDKDKKKKTLTDIEKGELLKKTSFESQSDKSLNPGLGYAKNDKEKSMEKEKNRESSEKKEKSPEKSLYKTHKRHKKHRHKHY
ncbi:hypothetical protein SteCoe_24067 [Stentor coeruleus]|uniref:Multiple myeloma tumor-associated protein 2-like N-terminal domain-containing protein n=1 Tax=Stentor coeruleus TaxID=5963 RepID=A0A1R2BIG6_9CILI|nr:hypothetical protein SteCoe_24067 [Stentor coeruleus]